MSLNRSGHLAGCCVVVMAAAFDSVAVAQAVVFQTDFDAGVASEIDPGAAAAEGVQGYAGLGHPGNQFGGLFLRSPTGNVKLGSLLASIAREAGGLTDAEVESMNQLRDKTPAEPMRFE